MSETTEQACIQEEFVNVGAIRASVERHERYLHSALSAPLHERVDYVMNQYERQAHNSINAAADFRDDMVIAFRALALVADMVANAGTHGEKNARLRGLIELLESTVRRIREIQFEAWRTAYDYVFTDVMRSDYPVRRYQERIRELEAKVEDLQKKVLLTACPSCRAEVERDREEAAAEFAQETASQVPGF